MNTEYSVILPYQIKYETEQPVPLNEIILALTSLQTLLESTSSVLSEWSEIDILGHKIYVEKIESGSLKEDIAVKLLFGSQESLDQFLAWMHQSNMGGILIGVVIGGVIMYGVNLLRKNNSSPTVENNISDNQNCSIFNIHGDILDDRTKEVVNKAIQDSVRDKDKLAKQTLNFFEPTRSDPQASISFGGEDLQASIQPDAIHQVPNEYKPRKNNRFEDLSAVKVVLRAEDLDSKKSGWAGAVDGITERVKITLDPTLETTALYGKKEIVADITLERDFSEKQNQMIPKRIIIRAIH